MTEPGLAAPPTLSTAGLDPQRYPTRWMQRLAEETAREPNSEREARAASATEKSTDDPGTGVEEAEIELQSGPAGLGAGILFVLGLIWLAATMWTAHAAISSSEDASVALANAAGALPVVIAASLLAGATAGLLATGRFAPDPSGPLRRLLVGLGAGTVLGALCAGVILFGYGANSSIVVLAITVGAGSALGGAAAMTPRPVFAASIVGTFCLFLLGVVFNVLQPRLIELFGAGETLASQAGATTTFAYVQSSVCGIAAGLVAFWFLRRHGSRAWPWYLLAGALPGLLLLLSAALTRTGGASLLGIVRDFSEGDRMARDFIDFSLLRNALVVIFVGGLASMIAVGRTMRSAE
jgi:hypothetical protein